MRKDRTFASRDSNRNPLPSPWGRNGTGTAVYAVLTGANEQLRLLAFQLRAIGHVRARRREEL